MKIYYIYHSCFIVETKTSFLIFDYYTNKHAEKEDFNFKELITSIFNSDKNLYVFASHNHHDHYNSKILSWIKNKSNTYYILSNDIKLYESVDNSYVLNENDEITLNNLTIDTFGSTDQGISFFVTIDNLKIFHAGDLNWWKWLDDTIEEEKEMESAYKNIIKNIIVKDIEIDVAFFPVDGRLEENYNVGGTYFIEQLNPKVFIPMHLWDDYSKTKKFKESLANKTTKIIEINHSNQLIEL